LLKFALTWWLPIPSLASGHCEAHDATCLIVDQAGRQVELMVEPQRRKPAVVGDRYFDLATAW